MFLTRSHDMLIAMIASRQIRPSFIETSSRFSVVCGFQNSEQQRRNSQLPRCSFASIIVGGPGFLRENEMSLADILLRRTAKAHRFYEVPPLWRRASQSRTRKRTTKDQTLIRLSRESGNLGQPTCQCPWTPAFAGATLNTLISCAPFRARHLVDASSSYRQCGITSLANNVIEFLTIAWSMMPPWLK